MRANCDGSGNFVVGTDNMVETIEATRSYLDYIREHYNNVQKAWVIIQDRCKDKGFAFLYDNYRFFSLDQMIKKHDESKLSKEEFVPYRMKFFPTKYDISYVEDVEKEFNQAWEHHKKHNDHHWENWVNIEHPYSEVFVVHNICDWMAMGMKFNDTAKEYYEKNKDKILVPTWADDFICSIFKCI